MIPDDWKELKRLSDDESWIENFGRVLNRIYDTRIAHGREIDVDPFAKVSISSLKRLLKMARIGVYFQGAIESLDPYPRASFKTTTVETI